MRSVRHLILWDRVKREERGPCFIILWICECRGRRTDQLGISKQGTRLFCCVFILEAYRVGGYFQRPGESVECVGHILAKC